MKIILSIIFVFLNTHLFSGELDGKGIDCSVNDKVKRIKEKKMWWFNNGLVAEVSAYYNVKDGKPRVFKFPLKILKKNSYYSVYEYNFDANYVSWKLDRTITYKLNRKNLEISSDDIRVKKGADITVEKNNLMTGNCRAFVGYEIVFERKQQLLEKAKDEYNKAREGNKI